MQIWAEAYIQQELKYLTFLRLGLLICKMGLAKPTFFFQDCFEDSMKNAECLAQ